jgi:hypothetical protein
MATPRSSLLTLHSSLLTLLQIEGMFKIPALKAMTKCCPFQNNPTLLIAPYQVQSPVSLSILREFLSALEGNAIKITGTDHTEPQQLCEAFHFSELATKL